jgi:hypothetical protein
MANYDISHLTQREDQYVSDPIQDHAFCLHTSKDKHDATFPQRHGVTVMMKFTHLKT